MIYERTYMFDKESSNCDRTASINLSLSCLILICPRIKKRKKLCLYVGATTASMRNVSRANVKSIDKRDVGRSPELLAVRMFPPSSLFTNWLVYRIKNNESHLRFRDFLRFQTQSAIYETKRDIRSRDFALCHHLWDLLRSLRKLRCY